MIGADGTGIFQHDLSAEVRDTFFEYFDKGMDLNQFKQQIGDEFGYESLECFKQLLNRSGFRALSQLEIEQMKSDGSFCN
jgi:hypothetical protein